MTKHDFDFDTWFESLVAFVMDETGVEFKDRDSVRGCYDAGRNLADVAAEISAEYE